MRRSSDLWILLGTFIVLLIGGFLFARQPNQQNLVSTSYNPDPKGVKAFYTLLSRLGYGTDRLVQPYSKMDKRARVLVLVEPTRLIDESEVEELKNWISDGNTLIVAFDDTRLLPLEFMVNGSIGRGRICAFKNRSIITNSGMRKPDNAVRLTAIVASHAGRGDLVLFDEYHHGFGTDKSGSEMSRNVKLSLGILILVGLILAYSRGRRFGAVRSLPEAESVRPGSDFVESVAALYDRANAPDVAVEILCDSFRRSLCIKLGVPADAEMQLMMRELTGYAGESLADRVGELLARCERMGAGHRPSERELLDIAGEIQRLERELGLGSIAA